MNAFIYSLTDADRNIAVAAVVQSETHDVTVIGEDTDVLVLLIYYAKSNPLFKLMYRSDKGKKNVVHDIHKYKDILGENTCQSILLIHAFTGCDTTSQFCSIGKGRAFGMLIKYVFLTKISVKLSSPGATHDDIREAGEQLACYLYRGKKNETLLQLRLRIFQRKVNSAKSFVKPERLPPTPSSLQYHSYRVYHQVSEWLGRDVDPEKWGWYKSASRFHPRTMDCKPAPDSLLKTIGCNCKGDCSKNQCGCRRGGYDCSSLCGPCQTNGCCTNQKRRVLSEDDGENSITEPNI